MRVKDSGQGVALTWATPSGVAKPKSKVKVTLRRHRMTAQAVEEIRMWIAESAKLIRNPL